MGILVLDATTKSIVVAMSGAAATTNPDFTAAWADDTGSAFTEGASDGALNGTSSVTLVAAPGASTRRVIKNITIENKDTAAVTVTISYDNNGTLRTIAKVTLNVGDTWINLSSGVTGTLGTANGGTGTTTGSLANCTVDGTNPVGYRNIPRSGSAKTTSYTLATGDIGEFIEVGSGGSVTIPDATFALGDVVSVFNNTTGNVTITCTITTAYIGGTDADKATVTLATRGIATILFLSGTVCVISGNVS